MERSNDLRLLMISPEFPPHIRGGLGTHVYHILRAMPRDITPLLLLPPGDYDRSLTHVEFRTVAFSPGQSEFETWLQYSRAALRAVLEMRLSFDLVHCHDWMTALTGAGLRLATGKPFIWNVHLPQNYARGAAVENIGLVTADAVLVNSRAMQHELGLRNRPIRSVHVIPNGVPGDVFRPSPSWPLDGGYVLFVGRLVAQKGLAILVRAVGEVLYRWPDLQLVVGGEGMVGPAAEVVARYLGLAHRVSFRGWQGGEDLVRLYQDARAVVVPSIYEPFGIVALEAMACGRPVIVSDVGGLREIVTDGVDGYLVPAGDHAALAQCMVDICRNPQRAREMGRNARARAESFTWDASAAATASVYRQLASESPPPDDRTALLRDQVNELDESVRPLVAEMLLDWARTAPGEST